MERSARLRGQSTFKVEMSRDTSAAIGSRVLGLSQVSPANHSATKHYKTCAFTEFKQARM
jgi:hypothetical protein